MSAFIVSNECMNKVVSAMLPQIGSSEQGDELGSRLFKMNAQAVSARYSTPEPAPTFRYRHRAYTPAQKLKAMSCLLYQCSEGDVPKLALYKELEDARINLALEIAQSLPEYETAAWDG